MQLNAGPTLGVGIQSGSLTEQQTDRPIHRSKLFGDRNVLDRAWRMVRGVYNSDGFFAVLWELAYQCLKLPLRQYTSLVWQWYRSRGRLSFPVCGHKLAVLPRDKGVSVELAVHGVHEPRVTRLLPSCLRPGMTAIDIGANIGYYVLLEARLVGQQGKVIAVEPVPQNAELLLHNLKVNGYANVSFQQIAISDRNGTLPLHLSEKSNWHSLHPVPWATSDLSVQVCTLDTLLAGQALRSVDLVRMDLEGHELAVLNGMLGTIEKYSPRILVEIHPHIVGPESMVQYLKHLKALGYSAEWVVDQERDVPWRWLFLHPEALSMDALISDWRINVHPRSLTVLFKRESAASVCRQTV
jgi:FkbM family methyltransferase